MIDARLHFGAAGRGATDDTAALQAAVDAAVACRTLLYIPEGDYNLTAPLILSSAGEAGAEQYLSVLGDGPLLTRLRWCGGDTGTALRVSYNKYFKLAGLGLYNAGERGTTVGMHLTGPTTAGTQTLAGVLEQVLVDGFHVGVLAGEYTGHATSEMLYLSCQLQNNDTGWWNRDLNTLDHVFVLLLLGGNGVGLDVNSGNAAVYGGSASGQTVADFALSNAGTPFSVRDFRSESSNRFIAVSAGATYHTVRVDGCLVQALANPDQIAIDAAGNMALSVQNSTLLGKVRVGLSPTTAILMSGNVVVGDTDLPFFADASAFGYVPNTQYDCRANLNYGTGRYYDDEAGQFVANARVPAWGVQRTVGLPGVRLNRVTSLSAGSGVVGRNLRLTTRFTGSGTLLVPFVREVTLQASTGSSVLQCAAGAVGPADVGKRIVLLEADGAGGEVAGFVHSLDSPTQITMVYTANVGVGVTGEVTARIGEDEPDGEYLLMFGCDRPERISWADKGAEGFTLKSCNASSTATVDVLVVR